MERRRGLTNKHVHRAVEGENQSVLMKCLSGKRRLLVTVLVLQGFFWCVLFGRRLSFEFAENGLNIKYQFIKKNVHI